jgi:predicted AlkP superfamily pyrophosphatase or phosphodiesterase
MRQRLEQLFSERVLIQPDHGQADIVSLALAIAKLAGAEHLEHSPASRALAELIGPADHLVFVLLDGLGMNLQQRLPEGSYLKTHCRREIRATSPSTTACALTSVSTASYPNRHGVTGWYTFLPDLDVTAAILPFVDRYTNQSLVTRGVRVEDVIPAQPTAPTLTHTPLTVVPRQLFNTPYNIFARAGTAGVGYRTIGEAVSIIIDRVISATGPTYTHLYLPEVDTLCHKLGVSHPQIPLLISQIDAELARLGETLGRRARVVMTADHGLIDVPVNEQTLLLSDDPLLELLRVPPTGDARMPIFHVAPGRREEFASRFSDRFGDRMLLLATDDAEQMHLFGPGEFSEAARQRFCDFVAIPFRPATLAYHPPDKALGHMYLAVHAGLSPEEMLVPLCIA